MKRKTLTPIDYAVMIGGPSIFIAIAILGIRSLIVTPDAFNPVKRLKDGMVKPGMAEGEVIKLVGDPKSTTENSTGGFTFRYEHGLWDSDRKTFVEEDAYVDFDDASHVSGISFESRTPPQPH